MEWNEETIARLRTLWDEGLSTAEIGRRIMVSKNAVVGKAHRLGLEPRPSPIRRDGNAVPAPRIAPPRRIVGSTLPAIMAQLEAPEAEPAVEVAPPSAPVVLPVVQVAPPVRAVAPARSSRTLACCWPIGEPGTKSFRFCDVDALSGKPYCAAHAQLAYVKVRDRREEAA